MNNSSFFDDEADENEFYDEYERAAQNARGIVGDEDDYGACPLCGGAGEAVARGRHHWLVCHRDRVKWRIGTGLFGSGLLAWITRGRNNWDRIGDWFKEYSEVAPAPFPAPQNAAPHLSLVPGIAANKTDEQPIEIDKDSDEIARFNRMFE